MPEKLLSTDEAAAELGVTRRRVQVLCEEGRIRGARRIGKVWVIPAPVRIEARPRGPTLRHRK